MSINAFKILRLLAAVDTIDWFGTQVHPNSGTFTVDPTPAAGDYTITIAGVANTVTRVAQTTGEIGDELAALITTRAASGGSLYKYVVSAVSDGAGVVTIVFKQTRDRFGVSTSAPGGEAITQVPTTTADTIAGGNWPITAVIPYDRRIQYGPSTELELCLVAVDASGAPLDPGTCTYTMEVLDVIERDLGDAVLTRGEQASIPLGSVLTVAVNGSHGVGVYVPTITNAPGGVDHYEIHYRPVVT